MGTINIQAVIQQTIDDYASHHPVKNSSHEKGPDMPPTQNAPDTSTATTSTGTTVTLPSTTPHSQSTFSKLMMILEALEPVLLAGASPFIKNPETQQIVATEAPVAANLFAALAAL